MQTLIYDDSFDGFLSCIFNVYELKLKDVQIRKTSHFQENIFGNHETIITNTQQAKRVWKGIKNKAGAEAQNVIYKSFLSEIITIEDALLHYIKKIFLGVVNANKDYSDTTILRLAKTVKMVDREKHRMDAFVRFRLTKDDIYFATVEPDFNVLPLNLKHFKSRYADQKWLIYDLKRNYGIYYDLKTVETVVLNYDDAVTSQKDSLLFFSEEELQFQELWKNYFKSTNIKSRKNMRLHLQHVPKRYWKYLSEKEGLN